MPKDESTNSTPTSAETSKRRDAVFGKGSGASASSANSNSERASGTGRSWSAGVIAGVAAAGLGIIMAAGIGGAAIGQAVEGSHHNKSESSEMRDHGKPGMGGDRDGKGGGDRDGLGGDRGGKPGMGGERDGKPGMGGERDGKPGMGGERDGMTGDKAGPGVLDPNAPTAPVDPNAVPGDAPVTG